MEDTLVIHLFHKRRNLLNLRITRTMNNLNKTVTFKGNNKPSAKHIKFLKEMGLDVVIQEEEISKSLSVTRSLGERAREQKKYSSHLDTSSAVTKAKEDKAKVRELKRKILIEKAMLEQEKINNGEYL